MLHASRRLFVSPYSLLAPLGRVGPGPPRQAGRRTPGTGRHAAGRFPGTGPRHVALGAAPAPMGETSAGVPRPGLAPPQGRGPEVRRRSPPAPGTHAHGGGQPRPARPPARRLAADARAAPRRRYVPRGPTQGRLVRVGVRAVPDVGPSRPPRRQAAAHAGRVSPPAGPGQVARAAIAPVDARPVRGRAGTPYDPATLTKRPEEAGRLGRGPAVRPFLDGKGAGAPRQAVVAALPAPRRASVVFPRPVFRMAVPFPVSPAGTGRPKAGLRASVPVHNAVGDGRRAVGRPGRPVGVET